MPHVTEKKLVDALFETDAELRQAQVCTCVCAFLLLSCYVNSKYFDVLNIMVLSLSLLR